jgi:predicted deacetylase
LNHLYTTTNAGLLHLQSRSEFAGVPLIAQTEKIHHAVEIFNKRSWPYQCFVAPSHSFDSNTLLALINNKLTTVSDGIALNPYEKSHILFVPATENKPKRLLLKTGVRTIVLHLNEFNNKHFEAIEHFAKQRHKDIIPFSEAVKRYTILKPNLEEKIINSLFRKEFYFRRGVERKVLQIVKFVRY